jgi:hypothetical protein
MYRIPRLCGREYCPASNLSSSKTALIRGLLDSFAHRCDPYAVEMEMEVAYITYLTLEIIIASK